MKTYKFFVKQQRSLTVEVSAETIQDATGLLYAALEADNVRVDDTETENNVHMMLVDGTYFTSTEDRPNVWTMLLKRKEQS